MKLKIAQLAQPILSTPPKFYGGTERIVSVLTEELVRRGHDVTLFATGDSKTTAKLMYKYKEHIGIDKFRPVHTLTQVSWAFDQADKFDLIHNHAEVFCLPLARGSKTPVVTTLHNDYIKQKSPEFEYFKDASNFVCISKKQEKRLGGINSAGVVYNSTDTEKYKFQSKKEDYIFFIGNLRPSKGPDIAVRIAKQMNEKMKMAVKIDEDCEDFFSKNVKPYVDGRNILLKKIVSLEEKIKLYQNAKCLVFPIRWEEPFGLVLIEAMSCGTPVVAFGRGSVPEIVKHGETGFIAKDEKEFKKYIKRIDEIDPKTCRRWVEKNFSIRAMTDGYENVYKKLVKG